MVKRWISTVMVCIFMVSLIFYSPKAYGAGPDDLDPEDLAYVGIWEEEEKEALPFKDVPEDTWYFKYVAMANEDGIMKGKSKEQFDPLGKVTMAEVATIAAKSYAYLQGETMDFKSKKGEKWYMPYVRYCYENGIYTTRGPGY